METINIKSVKDFVEKSTLSENAKKVVRSVLESSNYSPNGVEKGEWIHEIHNEWCSYLEAKENTKKNDELKSRYMKKLKLSRMTLGLVKRPSQPKYTPIRIFEQPPIPANEEFGSLMAEVFQKGYLETATWNGQEFIRPTIKLCNL